MIDITIESADEDWIVLLCAGEGIKDTRHTLRSASVADDPDLLDRTIAQVRNDAEQRQRVSAAVRRLADQAGE